MGQWWKGEKRRAKWYPRRGPGVSCQRDTGNFFAADAAACWKREALLSGNRPLQEIMNRIHRKDFYVKELYNYKNRQK